MNKQNFIKVFDPEKAEMLISLGYKYTLETVNGKTAYSFSMSEELMKYIRDNFARNDFLLSNKLSF